MKLIALTLPPKAKVNIVDKVELFELSDNLINFTDEAKKNFSRMRNVR